MTVNGSAPFDCKVVDFILRILCYISGTKFQVSKVFLVNAWQIVDKNQLAVPYNFGNFFLHFRYIFMSAKMPNLFSYAFCLANIYLVTAYPIDIAR